jgi:hypothetical protein
MPQPSNKPQPKNAGTPWTPELDIKLLHLLSENTTIEECALHFERTTGGISSRQMVIARDLVGKGTPVEEVSKIVNAPISSIENSLRISARSLENSKKKQEERVKNKQVKINAIFPQVTNETPMTVLKEIRDLLKEFDKRLNILEKNGKDEPVYL